MATANAALEPSIEPSDEHSTTVPSPLPPFQEQDDALDFNLPGCPLVRCRRCTTADVPALCDWCDVYLRPDYHFPRKQMHDVCARESSSVFAVEVAGEMAGFLVLYRGSTLHNLYLAPEFRRLGIGAALLAHFKPTFVRAKTNMRAGDPSPFYARNGYVAHSVDPAKPHIHTMARADAVAAETVTPPPHAADCPPVAPQPDGDLGPASPKQTGGHVAGVKSRNQHSPPPSWQADDAEAARLWREHKAKAALAGKTRRALARNSSADAEIAKRRTQIPPLPPHISENVPG